MKEQWGNLIDDDLVEGHREKLVGPVRYSITKDEAEAQVGAWEQKRGYRTSPLSLRNSANGQAVLRKNLSAYSEGYRSRARQPTVRIR